MPCLAHRIRLGLNNVQTSWMRQCAGAARYAFNWGLDEWQKLYAAGEKPSWQLLNKKLNENKPEWMKLLPWRVPNAALQDLGSAFSNFFRRCKTGEKPVGYPRFKKKFKTTPSFAIEGRSLQFDGRRLKIPKLGWVKIRTPLRFPGKVLSGRFSEHAGHWYISVQVEVDGTKWRYPHRCESQAVCGIDLGVVDLAVISNGGRYPAPRVFRKLEQKLRRLNKELSRRKLKGKNWQKTKAKIAKLYKRMSDVRDDFIHKMTAKIVMEFRWIGLENLNVKGMLQNKKLSKSIADAAMAEVRRQLVYKAALSGSNIAFADRWYPSSKTCSACGVVYEDLVLGERRWICDSCGAEHDRDENAAKNLKSLAEAHSATACCQRSAGPRKSSSRTKLLSGQESGSCVNQN